MATSGKLLLTSPAAQLFLKELGINADPMHQLDDFLKACEQANPRYKGGRDLVRFQLETDESKWPIGITLTTRNLAGKLGMIQGETPLTGEWDIIIALGGARRSPLHRACYAAQSIIDGRSDSKVIVIAGSTRLLSDLEKAQVQDFAAGAETEFDLCSGAAEHVRANHPELNVISICKEDPKSGNDGVIDETINICGSMSDKLRVAAVTTRIYVMGLELDMARAAKRHEWRGYAAAGHASDPEMIFNRSISTYLSECLTTLRKAAIAAAEGV